MAILILLFRHFGWINFTNPPNIVSDQTFNDILIAGIIGFIAFLIGELAGVGYTFITIATCGLACLLYPIFSMLLGYIKLYGTQIILPNWFIFDTIWWKVTIISITIGLIRIPSVKEQKKIIVKEKHK